MICKLIFRLWFLCIFGNIFSSFCSGAGSSSSPSGASSPVPTSNAEGNHVIGVGSTATRILHNHAMLTYALVEQPAAELHYNPVNSYAGLCRVKDYYTYCDWDQLTVPYADFASTEIALTDEDKRRWPDVLLFPMVAQGVVVVVNIPGYNPKAPNLIINRDVLVRIFSGNITWWNDTAIMDLQSTVIQRLIPQEPIHIVVRSDISGTTTVFTRALSKFSPEWEQKHGESGLPDWSHLDPERLHTGLGNVGVASAVVMVDYSIGYCDLDTAHAMGLQLLDFQQESGAVVSPELSAIEYAMYEKGMELADDNTADLTDAVGDHSWPIATYSYAVVRTNIRGDRLRQGGSCDNVRETVFYLEWFLLSETLAEMLPKFYAIHLAKSVQDHVVDQLAHDSMCGGEHIQEKNFMAAKTGELLTGYGPEISDSLFEGLLLLYSAVDPHTLVEYRVNDSVPIDEPLAEEEAWRVVSGNEIFDQEWFASKPYIEDHVLSVGLDSFIAIPWYLFSLNVVFHINGRYLTGESLVLDKMVLQDILRGNVDGWDNSHLNSLNPWLADQYYDTPFTVFGIDDPNDMVYTKLYKLLEMPDGFTQLGWKRIRKLSTHLQVIQAVDRTPGAIGIVPYIESNTPESFNAEINFADDTRENAVPLTMESLEKCVGPHSYDPLTFKFTPYASKDGYITGCYPLVQPVYIVMRYSYANPEMCEDEYSRGWQTTGFLRYLFLTGPELELPIIHETSLPLMWTANLQTHIDRLMEVMNFMPCGFLEPEPAATLDLFMLILYGGGGALILVGCITGCLMHYNRISKLKATNPLYGKKVQKLLDQVYEELKELFDGSVNTEFPQFASVPVDTFGISLMTISGHQYNCGDTGVKFTIQSLVNPVLYSFCVDFNGWELMNEMIGSESSKATLSADKLDPDGKPYNFCMDAAAIACMGTLPLGDQDSRYESVKAMLDKMTLEETNLDADLFYTMAAASETKKGIMEKLYQSNIIPSEYDKQHGLDAYFMLSSCLVSCEDAACISATFAGLGIHPKTKAEVLEYDIASEVNNVMMNCGMYIGASSWMVEVGFPAKASENGAIMAIIPNVCGICVYSPRLDQNKNSVRAVMAMQEISEMLGLHMLRKQGQGSTRKGSRSGSKGSTYRGGKGGSVRGGSKTNSNSASHKKRLVAVEGAGGSVKNGGSVRSAMKRKTSIDDVNTPNGETKPKRLSINASSDEVTGENKPHPVSTLTAMRNSFRTSITAKEDPANFSPSPMTEGM